MRRLALGIVVVAVTAGGAPAVGQIMFTATLDGSQEVPPVVTTASGSASLTLNAAQDRLDYSITLVGLDLDGNQTPADPSDDVTNLHFHNAPAGSNGPVVFGLIAPGEDADDIVINAAAGTVTGSWEVTDPASSPLATEVPSLLAGNLYLNVHTTTNPGGEIRGQIMEVPSMPTVGPLALAGLALLLAAAGALLLRRRPASTSGTAS